MALNFKKLADTAKKQIDKRGGTEAAKGDLKEVGDIFKGDGSLKDKAKAAGAALKEPGAHRQPESEPEHEHAGTPSEPAKPPVDAPPPAAPAG